MVVCCLGLSWVLVGLEGVYNPSRPTLSASATELRWRSSERAGAWDCVVPKGCWALPWPGLFWGLCG